MKRILFYMTCFAALLLQACNNEVDDLFDKSAEERLDEELQTCKELLLSAENGWVLDYYPQSNQNYGGYCMTVKFDDQQVTAASEITGDPTQTVSSLYSIKSDVGPTLNFDTYNEILHYFADPDNSAGAGLGKGYEGDYEFSIMSHTDNEIVLQGKKTKNTMHMYKLEESSESYLTKVAQMTEAIANRPSEIGTYEGTVNGVQIIATAPVDRHVSIQIGEEESQSIACVYTDKGIRLYEPISVNDTEINALEWSTEQNTFTVGGQALTPVTSPIYDRYLEFCGTYTMKYNNSSQDKEIDITVSEGNFINRSYNVEGLAFPLPLFYNETNDCFELLTSANDNIAMWEAQGDGYLTWDTGVGMLGFTQIDETTQESYYAFEDNGVWGSSKARALILYSSDGWYYGYGNGVDVVYRDIEFHKK